MFASWQTVDDRLCGVVVEEEEEVREGRGVLWWYIAPPTTHSVPASTPPKLLTVNTQPRFFFALPSTSGTYSSNWLIGKCSARSSAISPGTILHHLSKMGREDKDRVVSCFSSGSELPLLVISSSGDSITQYLTVKSSSSFLSSHVIILFFPPQIFGTSI